MEQHPEPESEACLDFGETFEALRELAGSWVGVEASPLRGSGPFLTLIGRLEGSWLLGAPPHRAIAFAVGDDSVRVAADSFAGAVRERYSDRCLGGRWSVVAIELTIGVVIEIEIVAPAGVRRSSQT